MQDGWGWEEERGATMPMTPWKEGRRPDEFVRIFSVDALQFGLYDVLLEVEPMSWLPDGGDRWCWSGKISGRRPGDSTRVLIMDEGLGLVNDNAAMGCADRWVLSRLLEIIPGDVKVKIEF